MPEFLLLVVIALVIAALVFGVAALVSGDDPGLRSSEPDGVSRGLPGSRPLVEEDLARARFDVALRGYRMSQVDAVMTRAAYDIGFKQELVEALRAEVAALREGRTDDAEAFRRAREAATGRPEEPGESVPEAPPADRDEISSAGAVGPVPGEQVETDRAAGDGTGRGRPTTDRTRQAEEPAERAQ